MVSLPAPPSAYVCFLSNFHIFKCRLKSWDSHSTIYFIMSLGNAIFAKEHDKERWLIVHGSAWTRARLFCIIRRCARSRGFLPENCRNQRASGIPLPRAAGQNPMASSNAAVASVSRPAAPYVIRRNSKSLPARMSLRVRNMRSAPCQKNRAITASATSFPIG